MREFGFQRPFWQKSSSEGLRLKVTFLFYIKSRQKDRQTHRQTHKQTHIQTHRQTHRHKDTQTHRHTDTQIHRQTPHGFPLHTITIHLVNDLKRSGLPNCPQAPLHPALSGGASTHVLKLRAVRPQNFRPTILVCMCFV